jgi:AraC-like DNA-binding protein
VIITVTHAVSHLVTGLRQRRAGARVVANWSSRFAIWLGASSGDRWPVPSITVMRAPGMKGRRLASSDAGGDLDRAGGGGDVLGDPVPWPGEPGIVARGKAVGDYLPAKVSGQRPAGQHLLEHLSDRRAADHLRREHDASRVRPLPGSTAILRALLEVLPVRAGDCAPAAPAGREIFTAFATAVDVHYANSREVAWYARRLGYSPRTLSRATHEAVGRSAKQFIYDRVALEAKRLLAHTDITVTECARRTGFDGPANFSKFFRARAGLAPGAFAANARARPAVRRP